MISWRTLTVCLIAFGLGMMSRQDESQKQTVLSPILQSLQGSWELQSQEIEGKKSAADEIKSRTLFMGGTTYAEFENGVAKQAGTIKINTDEAQKTVTLVVKQGSHEGDVRLGIFELNGDTLKLCFDLRGQNRPTEFKTKEKSGTSLATYKRCFAKKDTEIEIIGDYLSEFDVKGDKTRLKVTIQKRGDGYSVMYMNENQDLMYIGTGIRRGDFFCQSWFTDGMAGVAMYKIEKGPRLIGNYSILGGLGALIPETMTSQAVLEAASKAPGQ